MWARGRVETDMEPTLVGRIGATYDKSISSAENEVAKLTSAIETAKNMRALVGNPAIIEKLNQLGDLDQKRATWRGQIEDLKAKIDAANKTEAELLDGNPLLGKTLRAILKALAPPSMPK